MEVLLPRFRAAHTQVLGVSVDSVFCHANWGKTLGGISFPLLADFHPKGAMAASYGLFLEDAGITDRATVVVDATGTVRHASSVTPGGRRKIEELATLCETIDGTHGAGLSDIAPPVGVGKAATLFVKSSCGYSRKVLLALENLHLQGNVPVRNISGDGDAASDLVRLAGKDQAPCLIVDGKAYQESDEIVEYLVTHATDLD